MFVTVGVLERLIHGMGVELAGPEHVLPEEPVRLRITPAASELRASDLLFGGVSQTSVTKDVRFKTPGLVSPGDPNQVTQDLLGVMPITTPTTTGTLQPLDGTRGNLGMSSGTVPVAAEVPLRVEVRWSVKQEDGTPLTKYQAPEGTSSHAVTLLFPADLNGDITQARTRLRIVAEVKLSLETTTTGWVALTPVPLFVVRLPFLTGALDRLPQSLEAVRLGAGPVLPGQRVTLRAQPVPGGAPLPTEVPLRMETEWLVREVTAPGAEGLVPWSEGTDFEAPGGLRSPEVSLLFPWRAARTPSAPEPSHLRLVPRVRLSAGSLVTAWKELAPCPLAVLTRELLLLEVERAGAGPVLPGQVVQLHLRSPVLPLSTGLGNTGPELPGRIDLQWSVHEVVAGPGGDTEQEWLEGTDYEAPGGLRGLTPAFILPWRNSRTGAEARRLRVRAKVRQAGARESTWLELPPVHLALMTVEMLGLRILRDGSSAAMPGQRLSARVVSPVLPQAFAPAEGNPLPAGPGGAPRPEEFPVRADITWSIQETTASGTIPWTAGTDYEAPDGLYTPATTFLMPWRRSADTSSPAALQVHLLAAVTLTAGPGSATVNLTLPVEVLTADMLNLHIVRESTGPVLPGQLSRFRVVSPVLPSAFGLNGGEEAPASEGGGPLPDQFPVGAEVTWSVEEVGEDGTRTPLGGLEAPEGLWSPEVSFIFPWRRSTSAQAPTPLSLRLRATVKLKAGSTSSTLTVEHPLSVLTAEMLDLRIVRSERGPVLPGQKVSLQLLSPVLPLPALPGSAEGPSGNLRPLEVEWSVSEAVSGTGTPLAWTAGTDYEALEGLDLPALSLVFPWRAARSPSAPTHSNLRISARVRQAGGSASDWLTLPPLPLEVFTAEMLGLQMVRESAGPVLPGLPVPLKVLSSAVPLAGPAAPVQAEFSWSVKRGTAATTDFEAPEGLTGSQASLVFRWRKNTTAPTTALTYTVEAKVKLKAGSATHEVTLTRDLPVVSLGMLNLQVLREGTGPLMPGLPVALQVLSPALPLASSGDSRLPSAQLPPAEPGLPPLLAEHLPELEVAWTIKRVAADGTESPADSTDYEAPEGLAFPRLPLLFHWKSSPTALTYRAYATVRLRTIGGDSDDLELPALPLSVTTAEMLGLQMVRESVGPVLPGQPVPLKVLSPVVPLASPAAPVQAEFSWSVKRGTAATTDFEAPEGLTGSQASLVFRWRKNTAAPTTALTYTVEAKVKLKAGSATHEVTLTRDLPVVSLGMLNLQVLREGTGLLMPGLPVALQVLSPALSLASSSDSRLPPVEPGLPPLLAEHLPELEVAWTIKRVAADGTESPADNTDYEAPEGFAFPRIPLLFHWKSSPTALTYRVYATVRLRTVGGDSDDLELPALPLSVTTAEMLGLMIVPDSTGPIMPGQPLSLSVLAEPLPLGASPAGALANAEFQWSIKKGDAKTTDFASPGGLALPRATLIFPWRKGTDTTATYTAEAKVHLRTGQRSYELTLKQSFEVLTTNALKLQLVRDGAGMVMPGVPVSLQLLSPLLPLGQSPSTPEALPTDSLPAAPATLPLLEVTWSVSRTGATKVEDEYEAPEGLSSPRTALLFHWQSGTSTLSYSVSAKVRLRTAGGASDELELTLPPLSVLTADMLDLKVVPSTTGPVMPGQPVSLKLLSKAAPLAGVPLPLPTGLLPTDALALIEVQWSVKNGTTPITDYVAPDGHNLPQVTLLFPWKKNPAQGSFAYTVEAQVTLRSGQSSLSLTLSQPLSVLSMNDLKLQIVRDGVGAVLPGVPVSLQVLSPLLPLDPALSALHASPVAALLPSQASGALPQAEVTWEIRTANASGQDTGTASATDYEAPAGLSFLKTSFFFLWKNSPKDTAGNQTRDPLYYNVYARVTLRSAGGMSEEMRLGPIHLKVKTIQMMGLDIQKLIPSTIVPGQQVSLTLLSTELPIASPSTPLPADAPRIGVSWSVLDATGTQLLTRGTDFEAPQGMSAPTFDVIFPWKKCNKTPPEPILYQVRAVLRLGIGGTSSGELTLPDLPLKVMSAEQLQVPTIAIPAPVEPGAPLKLTIPTPTLPPGVGKIDAQSAASSLTNPGNLTLPLRIVSIDARVEGGNGKVTPLGAGALSCLFEPPVNSLNSDTSTAQNRKLVVNVKVQVGGVEVQLPELSVDVPVLPLRIPTVLGLFEHMRYEGACLVVVPDASPIRDLDALVTRLDVIADSIQALDTFVQMASFATGLSTLLTAIKAAKKSPTLAKFRVGNIRNLQEVIFKPAPWPFPPVLSAEDSITSVLLVGVPHTSVTLFERRNYEPNPSRDYTVTIPSTSLVRMNANVGDTHNDIFSSVLW